jgi:hypothetical protein
LGLHQSAEFTLQGFVHPNLAMFHHRNEDGSTRSWDREDAAALTRAGGWEMPKLVCRFESYRGAEDCFGTRGGKLVILEADTVSVVPGLATRTQLPVASVMGCTLHMALGQTFDHDYVILDCPSAECWSPSRAASNPDNGT